MFLTVVLLSSFAFVDVDVLSYELCKYFAVVPKKAYLRSMKRMMILSLLLVVWCPLFVKGERVAELMYKHMEERGLRMTTDNSVKFFNNGHDKFVDLFDEVRRARSFVHLEYFNFRNDSIAGLLFQLLAEKVKEGVEVRALYDAFGNSSNNKPIKSVMHDSIRALGIDLVLFDPIRFPWVNHVIPRDHRKIVVIDGRVAYTGGMNVADYYIDGIPGIGDWHDLHMRIEGSAVDDLHRIFAQTWLDATGERIEGINYFPREYGVRYVDGQGRVVQGSDSLVVIDRATGKSSDAIRDLFVTMIDGANKNIKLINPYFVPTHRVRQALKRAVDRGIDVQIMLSAKSDIPLTPEATHYVGNNLMKRGARVWLFEGGFHHTKLMIVDDEICTVGSSNMDARSLRCDYEVNTLLLSEKLTSEMVDLFEVQKLSAFEIGKGYWRTRTKWKQFVGWFGNLLTPVL